MMTVTGNSLGFSCPGFPGALELPTMLQTQGLGVSLPSPGTLFPSSHVPHSLASFG